MYNKIGTVDIIILLVYLQRLELQFSRETVKRVQTSPKQMFASRVESAANKNENILASAGTITACLNVLELVINLLGTCTPRYRINKCNQLMGATAIVTYSSYFTINLILVVFESTIESIAP